MKAGEYAEQYIQSKDKKKEIVEISRMFLREVSELQDTRSAVQDSAIVAIIIPPYSNACDTHGH